MIMNCKKRSRICMNICKDRKKKKVKTKVNLYIEKERMTIELLKYKEDLQTTMYSY